MVEKQLLQQLLFEMMMSWNVLIILKTNLVSPVTVQMNVTKHTP